MIEFEADGNVASSPRLDPASGDGLLPHRGRASPAHQQQFVGAADDGAHRDLGPLDHLECGGSAASGSVRCTVIARATRPCVSKKFLVLRSPGSARLSTPMQPR